MKEKRKISFCWNLKSIRKSLKEPKQIVGKIVGLLNIGKISKTRVKTEKPLNYDEVFFTSS